MSIAFFHQNEVVGVQGGIERYLGTLMDERPSACFLVTEDAPGCNEQRLKLPLPQTRFIPKWLRFSWAVWTHASPIRAFLKKNGILVLQFNRVEHANFAFLFPGKKIFTCHGTGPLFTEPFQVAVNFIFSWLVLFQADMVQIVGPDARALPGLVRKLLGRKIAYIDAWYDECFASTPFPAPGRVRIFYAGRLAPQKNPELLFAIARSLYEKYGNTVELVYFGSDGDKIPRDIYGTAFVDGGLQTPQGLAQALAQCHFGLLTSFYEGSPFIVIESLACGRGYILPPVLGLKRTYPNQPGVLFAKEYSVASFMGAISEMIAAVQKDELSPERISEVIQHRSKKSATRSILEAALGLAAG